jgi:hypothetical protein
MDDPRDISHDPDPPPMPSEQALQAMMDESDRDLAQGRLVPLGDVLADLDAAIEQVKAARASHRK